MGSPDLQAPSGVTQGPINDSWIAATAITHHVPVVTQDSDYDDVPGVEVIRI